MASLSLHLKDLSVAIWFTQVFILANYLLNGLWFCQCRHYCKCRTYIYIALELMHLGSWSLNLNALRSRFDVLKTTWSLIFLRQLLKMFESCFLASNDIFPKYSRDIVISFFWAVLESRIRLMNNLLKTYEYNCQ